MNNSTTPTPTGTITTTTTTTPKEEEVVEHVEAKVICPGYNFWGTAPVTLFTLIKGGYNPLLFLF